ncbi:heme ABC exporter ATP-binding protein CcmA [Camelimonas sp. ID_303_24]
MILTANTLSCRRGGRLIFRDISFRVASGSALVITGDNGAGKSSLIAMIAGLLAPAEGEITLSGDPDRTPGELIGLMAHRDGLKSSLTVQENLSWARKLLGASTTAIDEALEAVGLSHAMDMPVEHLSAGQRRRVSLARLLSCSRPIWLMDEPAGALDQRSIRGLTGLMQRHLTGGGIIIAATHQPLGLDNALTLHLAPPMANAGDDEAAFWEDDACEDELLLGYAPARAGQ